VFLQRAGLYKKRIKPASFFAARITLLANCLYNGMEWTKYSHDRNRLDQNFTT
jgi:hypothetical protein